MYVVCGIVDGCRGGGSMGPDRGGGGGGRKFNGLDVIDGVGGGDTSVVVDDEGLVDEGDVDPLVIGNRSG